MTNHVSKSELREELQRLDERFPSKQDLADVKQELITTMSTLVDDLKRHFDFTVEQIQSDKNDAVELQLQDHEERLLKLERKAA